MHKHVTRIITGGLLAATMLVPAVHAQLLDGIIGDSDSDSLVTIGSGEAGTGGAVNIGLGNGGNDRGNVLDANILPGSSGNGGVNANVSSGGDNGVLDADVGIGGAINANANVGGDSAVGISIGLGGGNGGGGNDDDDGGNNGGGMNPVTISPPSGDAGPPVGGNPPGGGGNDGGGNNPPGGGNDGGGNNGGNNNGGGNDTASRGSPLCQGVNPQQAIQLFEYSDYEDWERASGIEIIPLSLCPSDRGEVISHLSASRDSAALRSAVMADSLVSAALNRTRYGVDNVLAVQRVNAQLRVYVF